MGRTRKRFNWKARLSQLESEQSAGQPEEKVELDLRVQEDKYDESNPLVLSASSKKKKKTTDGKVEKISQKKPLSKKQRRRLTKILEKKRKKVDRAEILDKLQTVQATSEELEKMTSTSFMQTYGIQKSSFDEIQGSENITNTTSGEYSINSIKGSKRKKLGGKVFKKAKLDPNIVGYDDDDDDGSGGEEDSETDDIVPKENPSRSIGHSDTTTKMDAHSDLPMSQGSEKNLNVTESQNTSSSDVKKDSEGTAAVKNVSEHSSQSKNEKPCEPAVFIPVNRTPEIQAVREALPIYSEEQAIMEAIRENPVVVIHGATGSGKTTQVPQFLYEAGYTRNNRLIGITEPRRVAAVQMASRVAEEMNLPDSVVSYHIRYEKTATDDKTEIKFMTDGVLLKEIRHDFLLSRYSVIIIDEAHERSVFSDVLIGLLSRILPLREKKGDPLKLVIMSATLRVEDFTENPRLFKKKPFLITLNSRQYDVVVHFNMKTPSDYAQAAYDKVCRIHKQLPTGAILVFLTGEKEVTRLCKLLRKTFPFHKDSVSMEGPQNTSSAQQQQQQQCAVPTTVEEPEDNLTDVLKKKKLSEKKQNESFVSLPKIDLDNYSIEPLDSEGMQHQQSDDEEADNEDSFMNKLSSGPFEPLYVLPLYSVLPSHEQAKVFKPPPPGTRLCVVATNVAETSITIPGLKYVVDSGKVKTRVYDKSSSGTSTFAITWTSKASANQRAGRAGRTEGGHCYRLYSSAVFEHEFPEFTPPDIQSIPVDDILLQMKALGIDRVVNFPFPTPPDGEALKSAEKRLVKLGALEDVKKYKRFKEIVKWEFSAKVTPLGKAMARFPLSPRFAKMLLLSYKHDVIPLVIAVVSAMTVPEVFVTSEVQTEGNENGENDDDGVRLYEGIKKIGTGHGKSVKLGDAMVLLRAVAAYELARNKLQFCTKYKVRHKAMLEIQKMRLQLIREMNRAFKDLHLTSDLKLEPPTDEQVEKVRKIIASSMTDHVARRLTQSEIEKSETNVKNGYKCLDLEEVVYIHPSSVLFKALPEFVVYQEIFKTSRFYMRTVTEIEPEWLTAFATSQCEFSAPLETPQPYYDKKNDQIMCSMISHFGPWSWQLPCVTMPMMQGLMKYTWFCFFLLDGRICPPLKSYRKFLLSPASVILKEWARLLPRTRSILQAVINKEVDSKAALNKVWESTPKYLLSQYCEWLPEDKHMEVSCKWPPK